jgi:adenine-specific DNA-methyltransferase
MIKEWLSTNPIGIEDSLRHDKWCAMMWPRLRLLHELLTDDGSIWITLDDNEVHRARSMLDEIFGEDCSIGQIVWQKRTSRENRAVLSPSFDHVLVYSKALRDTWKLRRNRLLPKEDGYANPDNDSRGPWASIPFSAQGFRENQVYSITTPTGVVHRPPKGRRDVDWRPTAEVPIRPLLGQLAFTRSGNWGYQLRFGLFPIEPEDSALRVPMAD